MAMWNTMIGTSVLAMPWALQHSGFAMGIFVTIFLTGIASFTALTIVRLHAKESSMLKQFQYLSFVYFY